MVLVTGASGGIGSSIVQAFVREGAQVVAHHRSGGRRIPDLKKEIRAGSVLPLRADLTSEAEARRLFNQALHRFGRVDTLVANAASWETQDVALDKMTLRHWRRTMDGVLTTTFFSLREFLRIIARQKQGNAVLIGSTAAVFGEAGHADYAAAKSAIAFGLTRSIKNELARLAPHTARYCGGRINCVCPGWTRVPRLASKLGQPEMIRKALATMALPQIAQPQDIAHAVVFLSSDLLARHITGQTLVIAGGMEGRWLWKPEEIDPSTA